MYRSKFGPRQNLKLAETMEEYNMSVSKSGGYRANLLGHDAVTCCPLAENHFTTITNVTWLLGN